MFGLADYTYDHVERTLFADYLTYPNDAQNDADVGTVIDGDNDAAAAAAAAAASAVGVTTTTSTINANSPTFTTSPNALVKLQIGCSDPACARVGWLIADARASLVSHFQLTAALYPVKQLGDGLIDKKGDGDGDASCDIDGNNDNDGNDYDVRYTDTDIYSDDSDNANGDGDDVIPAGSVDVLYSSHTLEHISHFHSDAHDQYYFNR